MRPGELVLAGLVSWLIQYQGCTVPIKITYPYLYHGLQCAIFFISLVVILVQYLLFVT